MKMALRTLLCFLALSSVTAFAQAPKANEPTTQKDEQTLRSLLDEVRQLRVALQRANLNAYRAQITVERLRIQQDRVDRLARELEGVRREIMETESWSARLTERLKDLENQMNLETNASRRAQIETEYKDVKYGIEEGAKRQGQRRERETHLGKELQAEQLKLNELNDRLEALDREIEKQVTEETPKKK